jgi:predicted dehydrogenase
MHEELKANTPLRIAHIGAGEWSRHVHGPTLQRLAERSLVSLAAICDLQFNRAEEFRNQFGYGLASDNIDDVLERGRPDAIVCTVQPSATAELVKSLLPLGIPLFIEKPPGISLIEARSLAAVSQAAKVLTFVAFNRRSIPSIMRLKRWSGENRVRVARAEMLRTNRMEPEFAIATGIHVLDAMRFLLGNPTEIEVRRCKYGHSAVCDSWVRLLFPDAVEAEISMLLNTGIKRETYRLTADGASAEAALGAAYNADTSFQGDRYWCGEKIVGQHPLTNDRLVDDGIVCEYEEFIRLVATGAPSTCSLTDAAFSMLLAEAVQNGYSGPLPPLSTGS